MAILAFFYTSHYKWDLRGNVLYCRYVLKTAENAQNTYDPRKSSSYMGQTWVLDHMHTL